MKEGNIMNYNEEYNDYENENQYGYAECVEKVKEEIKQAIKEVKADEKKCPFGRRHKLINEKYKKEIAKNTSATAGNSAVKEILIRIGQVTFHITGEMYYQLLKLRYIKGGSLPKIIFGNRQLITTIVAGTFILTHAHIDKSEELPKETINSEENISQNFEKEYPITTMETKTLLMKKHLVDSYDTFYSLALDAGITTEELIEFNNYPDTNLLYGTIVSIPYEIVEKDLKYYTENAIVDDKTIKELASEYETDVETLIRLNKEAIEEENGIYNILSENIIVPKFITKRELQEKRAEQYRKNK